MFEVFNWTANTLALPQHESVISKYMFILKLLKTKIGKLQSVKYFSQAYGGDSSPLGGRTLMLEYDDFKAYEEFQVELSKREDFQGFQQAWGKLILPSTLRAQIWSDRNRNEWIDSDTEEKKDYE